MDARYKPILAIWLFQIANYLDRSAISFAGPSMMKSLHLDPQSFGVLLSAFAVGYTVSQIPGGLLSDRFGVRPVLVIAPLFWAIFTGLTGVVVGVAALVAVRLLFGISEGLSNTACYKVIGDNFDSKERAKATSLWASAIPLAPALAGPLIALLLVSVGWQAVFLLMVIPAVLAALVNYLLVPAQSRNEVAQPRTTIASFRAVLANRSLWVMCGAYFLFNIAYWGYLGWMPTYLTLQRHIDIKGSGILTGIPYMAGFVGMLMTGWLGSNALYRFRAQILAFSYIFAGGGLAIAYNADGLGTCIAGLSAAAFFLYGGLAAFGAIVIDLAPDESRAAFAGVVSTTGQIGGVVAPLVIGWLVSASGEFSAGFTFMIAALCIGAASLLFVLPRVAPRMVANPA